MIYRELLGERLRPDRASPKRVGPQPGLSLQLAVADQLLSQPVGPMVRHLMRPELGSLDRDGAIARMRNDVARELLALFGVVGVGWTSWAAGPWQNTYQYVYERRNQSGYLRALEDSLQPGRLVGHLREQ